MFLLDENIPEEQRFKLIRWHLAMKQIGFDAGFKGMDDRDDVLPLLHILPKPTFFTLDLGLYNRKFCHPRYCVAVFRVNKYEAAEYIRRFLKHPNFNTHRKRMGWVVEIRRTNIKGMRVGRTDELKFTW
jgi:hypothetical protein